jgi:hypothetical protein
MGENVVSSGRNFRTFRQLIEYVAETEGIRDKTDIDLGAIERKGGPGLALLDKPLAAYEARDGESRFKLYAVRFEDGTAGTLSYSTYNGARRIGGPMTKRLRVDYAAAFGKKAPVTGRGKNAAPDDVEDTDELPSGKITLGTDPFAGRVARSALKRFDEPTAKGGDDRESDHYLGGDHKPNV